MRSLFVCLSLLAVAGCSGRSPPEAEPLSIVLAGGTVYAGDDTPPVVSDIGISGDRIVAIGELRDRRARLRLDVGGLAVAPGRFASTEEVIELAIIAAGFGGIYISHIRQEGLDILKSVAETIRIGEEGGLPAQITHHKIVGAPMWGKSSATLALVDAPNARGVDVSIDQYPYTASSTNLTIMFPGWSLDGGREALLARLGGPELRQKVQREIAYRIETDRGGNEPASIIDNATFENPHQYATGNRHVFVSGQPVLLHGEMTGARPGRILRSTDYRNR